MHGKILGKLKVSINCLKTWEIEGMDGQRDEHTQAKKMVYKCRKLENSSSEGTPKLLLNISI